MTRKHTRIELPQPVVHPRYGNRSIRSGVSIVADKLARAYWGYSQAIIIGADGKHHGKLRNFLGETEYLFAASAIAGNPAKQKFSIFPRLYYVDKLRTCRSCRRWFIFYALEQRHWYETLGFWIDAECVHCHACRSKDQRLRRAQMRYAERIVISTALTDREFLTLLKDALFLAESGILKGDTKLRSLYNMSQKRKLSGEPVPAVLAFLNRPAQQPDMQ